MNFFSADVGKHVFSEELNEFYDIIFLDLAHPEHAILNVYKLLKPNGILVLNVMHLTQILKCLKSIENENLKLIQEIVIEPSIRLWEIERYTSGKPLTDQSDSFLAFKCRVEDPGDSKSKRDGIFSQHWPGFLVKFRKI